MKGSMKKGISILSLIAMGLCVEFSWGNANSTTTSSESGEGNTTVNVYDNDSSNQNGSFPPFVPIPWAGPGWYYGNWYDDEGDYHNDVNVSRSAEINQYEYDPNREWNNENAQNARDQWNNNQQADQRQNARDQWNNNQQADQRQAGQNQWSQGQNARNQNSGIRDGSGQGSQGSQKGQGRKSRRGRGSRDDGR